jgi:hypothetical protein
MILRGAKLLAMRPLETLGSGNSLLIDGCCSFMVPPFAR